jgi:hypothetical protein
MAISEIFQGIFHARSKRPAEVNEAQTKQGIERAATILAAYGKVLSEDKDGGLIADIKRLPNSKEEIKAAVRILLKVTIDPAMREHLRTGYIALSAYQPLTPNQKQAIRQWDSTVGNAKPMSNSDLQKMAQLIVESGDVVSPLQKIVAAEMDTLLQELDAEVTCRQ